MNTQVGYRALWRRFKAIKRAYWSLLVLSLCYILSLGAELICSGVPLSMQFEGQRIYPFLSHYSDAFYYSEDFFLGNGRQTRPDYTKILASERFRSNPANSVIMPPIPYGPYESMDVTTIAGSESQLLRLVPAPAQASVDIAADGTIRRSRGLQALLGIADAQLRGRVLSELITLTPESRGAIERRFANKEVTAFESPFSFAGGEGLLSIRAQRARSSAPTKLRLRLKQQQHAAEQRTILFSGVGEVSEGEKLWQRIAPAQRDHIRDALRRARAEAVTPFTVMVEAQRFRAHIEKQSIAFPLAPSADHLLGLDDTGRDVLARILYGFRTSMTFAIVLVFFSMALGVCIGALQGYFGGVVDMLSQRAIEIWQSLPFLYVMIFMGAVYGQSFLLLLFCYAIFNWIGISYYLRAEFLRLRRLPFVESARSLGLPTWRIIFIHMLPNALVPIITFFPFSLVSAISSLTALDYLGFGLPVPTPSWGELFKQAQNDPSAWWLILYPFLALFAVILLGVFIGEGARAAFDPKRRSRLQ